MNMMEGMMIGLGLLLFVIVVILIPFAIVVLIKNQFFNRTNDEDHG